MKNRAANALVDVLNSAVGALMEGDPDGKQKLAELHGSVFCLELTAPAIKLYLLPTERGIEFHRDVEAAPDVTLVGSAAAFAKLGRAGAASGVLTEGKVTVRGDAELGQAFQKILSELDLDWEELLSRYIGDAVAHKVGTVARELADWAGKSAELTRENAADYLQEEKRILVSNLVIERFEQAVNRTRADIDRLTQRVERLKHVIAQRETTAPHPPE